MWCSGVRCRRCVSVSSGTLCWRAHPIRTLFESGIRWEYLWEYVECPVGVPMGVPYRRILWEYLLHRDGCVQPSDGMKCGFVVLLHGGGVMYCTVQDNNVDIVTL